MASPAARKPDKPTIDFNVDAWKPDVEYPPYSITVGHKRFVLEDPNFMDFRDVMMLQSLGVGVTREEVDNALRLMVGESDREDFVTSRFPTGAFVELMKRYAQHFGMDAQVLTEAS